MYRQDIIKACKQYGLSRDEAAYVLGTAHWETNATFLPVREAYWIKGAESWRKRNLRYYPYYGRGFVQLTWEDNYKKAGEYFGVDFVKYPDKVMEPKYAIAILVVGMRDGWFTDVSLDEYIDSEDGSTKEDFLEFYNARRIVNGMDKANEIAVLAEKYERELKEWNYDGFKVPLRETEELVEGVKEDELGTPTSNLFIVLLRLLIKWIRSYHDTK